MGIKKTRLIATILIFCILISFSSFIFANDATLNYEILKFQGYDLIYFENLEGTNFRYSINDEGLLTYPSILDEENGSNCAIITYDDVNFSGITVSKMLDVGTLTKLTIKYEQNGQDKEIVIDNISEDNAISANELHTISNLTKIIPGTTGVKEVYRDVENEEGRKETLEVGTFVLTDPDPDSTYSYYIIEAGDAEDTIYADAVAFENYEQLNKYNQLNLARKFLEKYKTNLDNINAENSWILLTPNEDGELEIMQPQEAENGTNYVIFLKKEISSRSEQIDIAFLTSQETKKQSEEPINGFVQTVQKLPITGENITYIASAVVLIALIVIIGLKIRANNKKETN